jgi:hypothetical protein
MCFIKIKINWGLDLIEFYELKLEEYIQGKGIKIK